MLNKLHQYEKYICNVNRCIRCYVILLQQFMHLITFGLKDHKK